MSGTTSYHAGISAEDQIARQYARSGHVILSRRWRGKAGEIDLVTEKDGVFVFVEVKKSRSHARAAERLSRAQIQRIYNSAEDYIGQVTGHRDADARIDVALVDGAGRFDIIENAYCA